ncbi:MAG: hypothetical protein KBS82_05550 [Oscillospiraceae bacterium]|nr:hypothetical protein [Candidatus Limimonas egerieequi]
MKKPIDLIGCKFGRLTVLEKAEKSKDGRSQWLCKCDCGNERIVLEKSLKNGHTKSCGCLNKEINSMRSFKDHTGERFGRLTVVSRAEDYIAPSGKHHVRWLCECDCGNSVIVDVSSLVRGHTKSCGCLHEDVINNGTNTSHGGRYDRLYKVLANMKNRCYNTNASDYKYYGGRGITICDEWLNDYNSFKTWALENGYDENAPMFECTIDRIDVNGNYEPNNCRWVSMDVQSRNRRNVINK